MSTFNELIDFTRSTTGTYLDSVVYGDELVTNGTFATDSDWDKQNGWSIDGGEAVYATGTGREIVQISIPTVAGKTYKVEFDITSRVVGAVAAYALESVQNNPTYKSTVGSHVRFLTATGSVMALRIRSSATTANLSIDNVSLKEVIGGQVSGTPLLRTAAINEPRLEYDASGNALGLLIEEQRTNKLTYSQDYTQSEWLKESVTVATAPVAAPDGTMTATHVVRTGGANTGHLVDTWAVTTSDRNSIWARTVSGTGTMHIGFHEANSLITLTEEWQRFDVQCNNNHVYAVNFRGSATLTECYIWGSQAETGSFPTSYIPTSGSAVTRSADVASLAVSKFGYNQDQFSVVVESDFFGRDSAVSTLCCIGESSDDRVLLYYNSQDVNYQVKSAGSSQVQKGVSGLT